MVVVLGVPLDATFFLVSYLYPVGYRVVSERVSYKVGFCCVASCVLRYLCCVRLECLQRITGLQYPEAKVAYTLEIVEGEGGMGWR